LWSTLGVACGQLSVLLVVNSRCCLWSTLGVACGQLSSFLFNIPTIPI